jgi:putative ABC transport system permease protein
LFRRASDSVPIRVIGLVEDVRDRRLDEPPVPQMYSPMDAMTSGYVAVVARGVLPPSALLGRLAASVRSVDPSQAVYNVRMMEDVLDASVAQRRTHTGLIGGFGAVALLLAAFGVYAVVASGVAQRTRELGIRSALGASGVVLMRLVAGEMLWVTLIGLTAGLGGAWMLSRLLEGLVYGVHVHDPMTFLMVPLILVLSAALATLIPARRAMHTDPIEVMRAE